MQKAFTQACAVKNARKLVPGFERMPWKQFYLFCQTHRILAHNDKALSPLKATKNAQGTNTQRTSNNRLHNRDQNKKTTTFKLGSISTTRNSYNVSKQQRAANNTKKPKRSRRQRYGNGTNTGATNSNNRVRRIPRRRLDLLFQKCSGSERTLTYNVFVENMLPRLGVEMRPDLGQVPQIVAVCS